ncbi:protein of unknown function [Burkholderia multivorans]
MHGHPMNYRHIVENFNYVPAAQMRAAQGRNNGREPMKIAPGRRETCVPFAWIPMRYRCRCGASNTTGVCPVGFRRGLH